MVVVEWWSSCRNTFLKAQAFVSNKVLQKVRQCFHLNLRQLQLHELHQRKGMDTVNVTGYCLYTVKIDSAREKFGFLLSKYLYVIVKQS